MRYRVTRVTVDHQTTSAVDAAAAILAATANPGGWTCARVSATAELAAAPAMFHVQQRRRRQLRPKGTSE